MKTAKALGFVKGDCVQNGNGFVGVLIADVHTATPCVEVWGFAHEGGSCYSNELRKITVEELKASQYFLQDPHPFSAVAKKTLGVK